MAKNQKCPLTWADAMINGLGALVGTAGFEPATP